MTFLESVCSAFGKAGLRYALVGGHAVALHGAIRGTVDIDFVLNWDKDSVSLAEKALNKMGLVSRIPVDANDIFEFRDEYITKRNLISWNFFHPEDLSKQVDIIINYDLSGHKVKQVRVGVTSIRLLDINELIEMKTESGRDQDLADVKALTYIRDHHL